MKAFYFSVSEVNLIKMKMSSSYRLNLLSKIFLDNLRKNYF